ncbi:MAG: hypothetical protein NTW49_00190 [Bacteroidia bacterium]|nr:hypothetical protein [Bacteroidia bacterium]
MKYLAILLIILLVFSCNRTENDIRHKRVAKAGDSYLFLGEIMDIVPDNLSKTDSVNVTESYINQWIKKTLKLNKADMNLTAKQKDVSKELEEYKSSLLIFKYEQLLIKQKLDTIVTQEDITSYYKDFNDQLLLDRDIVKAEVIVLKKDVPKINQLRSWLKSSGNKNSNNIIDFCHSYAGKFDDFNNEWVYFDNIAKNLPLHSENLRQYVKKDNFIEAKDSVNQYFVKISDVKLKGSVSPLVFVKNNIKDIILNKRKIQIIKDLDEKLYEDALNKNEIKIYKD